MVIYQILHIPSGEYLTSVNRERYNSVVLFSSKESAAFLVDSIVSGKQYVAGAPISDYCLGNSKLEGTFYSEEFELIPSPVLALNNMSNILKLSY